MREELAKKLYFTYEGLYRREMVQKWHTLRPETQAKWLETADRAIDELSRPHAVGIPSVEEIISVINDHVATVFDAMDKNFKSPREEVLVTSQAQLAQAIHALLTEQTRGMVPGKVKAWTEHHNDPDKREYWKMIGANESVASLETISVEVDIEKMAKETYEIYHYPDPTMWEDLNEYTREQWRVRTEMIADKKKDFLSLRRME